MDLGSLVTTVEMFFDSLSLQKWLSSGTPFINTSYVSGPTPGTSFTNVSYNDVPTVVGPFQPPRLLFERGLVHQEYVDFFTDVNHQNGGKKETKVLWWLSADGRYIGQMFYQGPSSVDGYPARYRQEIAYGFVFDDNKDRVVDRIVFSSKGIRNNNTIEYDILIRPNESPRPLIVGGSIKI